MTFEKTLRSSLMFWSYIFHNALEVYDHLFLVIGNGYEWKNGQLVSHEDKKPNLREAIQKEIQTTFKYDDFDLDFYNASKDIFESDTEAINYFFETSKKMKEHEVNGLLKRVDMIFNTDERMTDFSFEAIENEITYKTLNEKFMFYPISKYSEICNLPDNIKKDWLEAAERFYNFMLEHKDRVEDPENFIPRIGERIKELKEKLK